LGVEYVTTEGMQDTHDRSLGAKIAQWAQFYQIGVRPLNSYHIIMHVPLKYQICP
jgi:hypothetical protein